MSVISRPAATPNRLEIIIRVLAGYSQSSINKEELLELISPPFLTPDAPEDGPGATAINALAEARVLGLVAEEVGASGVITLTLAEPFRGATPQSLLSYLEPILVGAHTGGNASQADMPKMLTWLLAQDPRTPIDLASNLSSQTEGILNSTALAQQFAYWARFLGYAWHFAGATRWWLVPDPSGALSRHLPSLIGGEGEVQLGSLPERWAAACPVLGGGPDRPFDTSSRQFSRATSLALLRLEQKGNIRLTRQADAPAVLLAVGNETITYTHVALAQPATARQTSLQTGSE